MMRTRQLLTVAFTVALTVVGLTGCGGEDDKPTAKPTVISTPGVQPDGRYQVGTLPDESAQQAVLAAVEAIPVALSYDHRTIGESLKKATALMTDDFAKEFTTTFEASTRSMAIEKQAITSALIRAAGVVGTVRDDAVTCLVYLDQVLVASKDKKADDPLKVSQNSVRVAMVKVGQDWKVDGIEPF